MARSRPRPRRTRQAAKSKLSPCVYREDRTLPDPVDPDAYLCACGLRRQHPRHDIPDTTDAQAEHRRRAGGDA